MNPERLGEFFKTINIQIDMKTHSLKTWPEYYQKVIDGKKKFERRVNDRDYQEGDILILNEWCPEKKAYTGRSVGRKVVYILYGGEFDIPDDVVIMSIDYLHEFTIEGESYSFDELDTEIQEQLINAEVEELEQLLEIAKTKKSDIAHRRYQEE